MTFRTMLTNYLSIQNHKQTPEDLSSLDDYFFLTASKLNLNTDEFKDSKINLVLNSPHSYCDENGIYIQKVTEKGGLNRDQWLELLFKHELTHFLSAKKWGMPPSIFFEGLAVFMSDMDIKARELGQSYHRQALALIHTSHYIPFSAITYSHHYLGRRNDFRCDVEAGSFIAFLVERHSMDSIRRVYEKSKLPTHADPSLNIHEVCKEVYGRDLSELESDWHQWLKESFEVSVDEIEKLESFADYNNEMRPRCPYTLVPL